VARFEDDRAGAGSSEVRAGDEAVVPSADDGDVYGCSLSFRQPDPSRR
jgi:hypothetical protein